MGKSAYGEYKAGKITTTLVLNSEEFNAGIESATKKINSMVESINKGNNFSSLTESFNVLIENVDKVSDAFAKIPESIKKASSGSETLISEFEKVAESANTAAASVSRLKSGDYKIGSFNNMSAQYLQMSEALEGYLALLEKETAMYELVAEGGEESATIQMNALQELETYLERLTAIGSNVGDFRNLQTQMNSIRELIALYSELDTRKIESANIVMNTDAFTKQINDVRNLSEAVLIANERIAELGVTSISASEAGAVLAEAFTKGLSTSTESIDKLILEMDKLKLTGQSIGSALNGMSSLFNIEQRMASINTAMANYRANSNGLLANLGQTKTGFESLSSSMTKTNTSMNGLASSLLRVSSLFKLFGSLYVFQTVIEMGKAVKETVKYKSEMEALVKQLGWSTSQVDYFNKSLDNTIKTYQKMNKYNMGETLASLGQEFGLGVKELEQAAPVLAMVQSEYVRAGRSTDEATLAVKDVLQGEFVRLSRETGVGKGELMAAGWSGDNKDVRSLLTALKSIGESRHWDMFATKATSLTDVMTILQNRFAEFAGGLVSQVTPLFLLFFNGAIQLFEQLGSIFNDLNEKLGGGLSFAGWTIAIGGATAALVMYRTEAGLVQIAQMGLLRSITATILGIEAEKATTLSSSQMILAKILGLSEETAAYGSLTAGITAKNIVTDLETMNVEKNILAHALSNSNIEKSTALKMADVVANEMTTASIEASTLAEYKKQFAILLEKEGLDSLIGTKQANIIAERLYAQANLSTTKALMAKLLGLEPIEVKEYGLTAAIMARVLAVKTEEAADSRWIIVAAQKILALFNLENATISEALATDVANVSTKAWALSMGVVIGTVTALLVVLVAVVVVITNFVKAAQSAADAMSDFNSLVKNGDSIISEAKTDMETFNNKANSIKETMSGLKEGTAEYNQKAIEYQMATKNAATATRNYQIAVEAVKRAKSSQAWFDNRKIELETSSTTRLTEKLQELGYAYDDASIKASGLMAEWDKGQKILQQTAKGLEEVYARRDSNIADVSGKLLKAGLNPDDYIDDMQNSYKAIADGYEKMMTGTSLMDKFGGWLDMQKGEIGIALANFWGSISAGDYTGAFQGIGQGIMDFFTNTFNLDKLGNIDWEAYAQNFVEQIPKVIEGLVKSLESYDWDAAAGNFLNIAGKIIVGIGKGLANIDWLKFIGTLFRGLGDIVDFIAGVLANILQGIGEWIYNNIETYLIKPIYDWFNNFDLYSYLGNAVQSVDKFFGWLFGFGETPISEAINNWFTNTIIQPINDWKTNFDLWSYLGNVVETTDKFFGWLFGFGDTPISEAVSNWVMNQLIPGLATIFSGHFLFDTIKQYAANDGQNNLLDTLFGTSQDWWDVGWKLAAAFGDGILQGLFNIPIVGPILKFIAEMLGYKPQFSDAGSEDAEATNKGFGDNLDLGTWIDNELDYIGQALDGAKDWLGKKASAVGSAISWAFGKLGIGAGSPGNLARYMSAEMGYINEAMVNQQKMVADTAANVGSSISNSFIQNQNMSASMNMDVQQPTQPVIDQPVLNPNANQQAINQYGQDQVTLQAINTETMLQTQTTFNGMSTTVGDEFVNMGGVLTTTFDTLKTKTATDYQTLNTTTATQMQNMQTTTTKHIQGITNSWNQMETALINSASNIRQETGSHIKNLESNMASFWSKVQNPGLLIASAGPMEYSRGHYSPRSISSRRSVGSAIRVAGSPNMGISNKYRASSKNDPCLDYLGEYLKNNRGVAGGWGFDWTPEIKGSMNDWHTHFGPIYDGKLRVGKFYNDDFPVRRDTDIFKNYVLDAIGRTSYEFYWDSKYGNALNAWNAGHFNCYDGALVVMALAKAFGLGASMVHTTWDGIGHMVTNVEGVGIVDATAIQNGYGLSAPGKYAGPLPVRRFSGSYGDSNTTNNDNKKVINVNIDLRDSNLHKEDDLVTKIENTCINVMSDIMEE